MPSYNVILVPTLFFFLRQTNNVTRARYKNILITKYTSGLRNTKSRKIIFTYYSIHSDVRGIFLFAAHLNPTFLNVLVGRASRLIVDRKYSAESLQDPPLIILYFPNSGPWGFLDFTFGKIPNQS